MKQQQQQQLIDRKSKRRQQQQHHHHQPFSVATLKLIKVDFSSRLFLSLVG